MKKYLVLLSALLAGPCLYAAEDLTFKTVLSRPVGSFWELKTVSCAYPDVSGRASSQSDQVVVNFGPTKQDGQIKLLGGPMRVDTLLMEDGSTLTTGSNVALMFAQTDTSTSPATSGKLTIYPGGRVATNSILIHDLFLPKAQFSTIQVQGTTKLFWSVLKVKDATLRNVGNFNLAASASAGDAKFKVLYQSAAGNEDTPSPSGYTYYLQKTN